MRQRYDYRPAILFVLASPALVAASPTTKPHDSSVTVEQRARDSAVQHLIDSVLDLRLATGQTISVLLAPSGEAERELRGAVVDAHKQGARRQLTGGHTQVDVWLPTANLAVALRETITRHLPRLDPKLCVPARTVSPIISATGTYGDQGRLLSDQPGWRHCDSRAVALAKAAAAIDLRAALFDRLAGLGLPGPQTVGDLVGEHPAFGVAVRRHIDELVPADPVLEPSGLCRRSVTISRAEVISLLVRAATDSNERISADFARMTDPTFEGSLIVSGYGLAPPVRPLGGATTRTDEPTGPAWADGSITTAATGKAPPEVVEAAARRELATKAARIEATRQLWLDIEALPLPEGGTIADLLADDPNAVRAFALIDGAILSTGTPVIGDDGTATVSVSIHLQAVWRIVRDLPRENSR